MRSAITIGLLVMSAGCRFDGSSSPPGVISDSENCFFQGSILGCVDTVSSTSLRLESGRYTLDTDQRTLSSEGSVPIPHTGVLLASDQGVPIAYAVITPQLIVASGARVRAIGSLPLALIASESMTIAGVLDVASALEDPTAPTLVAAPGAGSGAGCPAAGRGQDGGTAPEGGGGGGGGGFGGPGAPGAAGHPMDDDPNKVGGAGGAGGAALPDQPAVLRGGCPGGNGGQGNTESVLAAGGAGGGGLYLVSGGLLWISGDVLAGGSGGIDGQGHRSGGGGGGSGGMIALEGNQVELTFTSRLAANGGGGAGGINNTSNTLDVTPGQSGLLSTLRAEGGEGEIDSDGGKGSGVTSGIEVDPHTGTPGTSGDRGGGGGGGAAGLIVIYVRAGLNFSASVISPSHITINTP